MSLYRDPRNPHKGRQPRPVRGTARWLCRPDHHGLGGVLEINGQSYELLPLYTDDTLDGYRLLKSDGTMYDLPRDLSGCDCPAHTYRPEQPCKHMLALKAAFAHLADEGRAA
jgi:hypothetical protein